MLLLSVDTSGKHGGIALAQCSAESCAVLQSVPLVGGTFSAQLIPQIAALLSEHGFSKLDIGGFAVATGPGSFTGLRVGLAAIKALAEVLNQPIARVSLLEAIAAAHSASGKVLAMMDAGRGEVFVGKYEIVSGHQMRALSEQLLKADELDMRDVEQIITPDQNVSDLLLRKGLKTSLIERPGIDVIARLGWRKIQAGDIVSAERLEANYIRQSDAEIFFKPQR